LLDLTRQQILAFRRRAGSLDERLPLSADSLRRAAWAGLQDSMPRAALLQLHARVADVGPRVIDHASLAQCWGPRFSTYVVPKRDFALFTVGRYPDAAKARERAERMAEVLQTVVGGRRVSELDAGRTAGLNPNALKYATATGTVAIRWEGARGPTMWLVPRPTVDPAVARRELARRYLHVFGPATVEDFATWAGISPPQANATFAELEPELLAVRMPIGEGRMLATDEPALRAGTAGEAPARLLPSGDPYFLLQGAQRELLVPDAGRRALLWTTRVWPGALLVAGELWGTWRRDKHTVRVDPWSRVSRAARAAVEAEAATLPLPGLDREIAVVWNA
jgi:hypothetical protein